jgi:hypothetical protein
MFNWASDFATKIPVTVQDEKSAKNKRSPFFAFEWGPYCPPDGHLEKNYNYVRQILQ